MKVKRKVLLSLGLILVASMVMSACGTSTPTPSAPTATSPPVDTAAPAATSAPVDTSAPTALPERVEIKIVDWAAEGVNSWNDRWYKAFEESHPNIKLVHEQVPADRYIETILTRISGANDIDIIISAPAYTGNFLRSGVALELTPYIEKDADILQLDQFVQWTLEDYTEIRYPELDEPGQYGLPLVIFVWEFWFNTDMLTEAGLSTPQRGWTWDDFATICEKVTDPANKLFGYQHANWLLPLWPWVWQNGGEVLTSDGSQLAIGSEAAVEAFSFLQKLQVEDNVFAPPGQGYFFAEVGYDSGNAAMVTRGNWAKDLSPNWAFQWDVSYPPTGKIEATMGEQVGLIINKTSPKIDAAWEVLSWLMSPEGQEVNALQDIVPNTEVMREFGLQAAPDNVRNIVVPLSSDPMVRSYPVWYRPNYTPDDLLAELALLWTGEAQASELLPALDKPRAPKLKST